MPKKTLIAAAAGSAFVASMTVAPIAAGAENPFALSGLSSGYHVADNQAAQPVEGKYGATKKDAKEAEMNPADKKMPEGKCGEGKCGAAKSKGDANKAEPGKTSTEK